MLADTAVIGPSQFFTLDAACWYGCKETGAENCEEVCRTPSFSVTGTGTPVTTPAKSNLQWWILGAFGAVALIVAAR